MNFQVDHGSTHSQTRHAGDFGNIDVDSDGNGKIDLTIPAKSGSTLFGAEDQRILGRTLVIHELEDDLGTLSGSTSGIIRENFRNPNSKIGGFQVSGLMGQIPI